MLSINGTPLDEVFPFFYSLFISSPLSGDVSIVVYQGTGFPEFLPSGMYIDIDTKLN